jgi:hypothetical protein
MIQCNIINSTYHVYFSELDKEINGVKSYVGHKVARLVEALFYKSGGRGFDS